MYVHVKYLCCRQVIEVKVTWLTTYRQCKMSWWKQLILEWKVVSHNHGYMQNVTLFKIWGSLNVTHFTNSMPWTSQSKSDTTETDCEINHILLHPVGYLMTMTQLQTLHKIKHNCEIHEGRFQSFCVKSTQQITLPPWISMVFFTSLHSLMNINFFLPTLINFKVTVFLTFKFSLNFPTFWFTEMHVTLVLIKTECSVLYQ